jgi:SpoVK/Ycf46/Vps4 family AAA+-type ATPase
MAESVAEYTGRPLLKVSVADVGLQGTKVEKKLENIFQLASRWEAVLLFDEADILLEMRTDEAQLERNSMVSVFLKILEYYEGILLLTTNRTVPTHQKLGLNINLTVSRNPSSRFRGPIARAPRYPIPGYG